jgi:hypothetical protein
MTESRFRNPLWPMIPMDEEPPEIHRQYVRVLKNNGVEAAALVVED